MNRLFVTIIGVLGRVDAGDARTVKAAQRIRFNEVYRFATWFLQALFNATLESVCIPPFIFAQDVVQLVHNARIFRDIAGIYFLGFLRQLRKRLTTEALKNGKCLTRYQSSIRVIFNTEQQYVQ